MNLIEILKDVPKGTKLYSPAFGNVKFKCIHNGGIMVEDICDIERLLYINGNFYMDGECMLFPSKDNRDWNTFKKFDITTLKPFDKVLVRDYDNRYWNADFYSYYRKDASIYNYECVGNHYNQCIPYNEDTKHLVGTTNDCPEYYKNW